MASVTTEGYRISPAQKRLWLQQQRSSAYLAQAAIKIEGPVDIAALETAVARVVDRLEILRTTFRRQAGMRAPLQVITGGDKLTWRRIDWSGQNPSQIDTSLEGLLGEQRTRSVNLETGPLLELCLAKVSAQEQYLIVSLPSLCADAQSLTNLFEEIVNIYAGDSAADESEPLQYADFADWHCQLLDDDEPSPAKAYWREQRLNAASLPTIRRVRKRESQVGFEVAITALPIDQETALAAKSLARDKDIPVADFYLACWQTLAWRLFGQPDVVIGAVANERGHETLRDACGLFSVTLPVRHRFDDGMRFDEILDAVVRSRNAVSDWQYEFSWERNVEGGGNDGEPAFLPLAFHFHTLPVRREAGPAAFSLARSFACTDRFHIQLNCVQSGDAIDIEWHFDSNLLLTEEIERLARHYRAIVRSAADNPRRLALDLEVLDEAQRQEIAGFNGSRAAYPIDLCVHERFEEVARRAPDRPALVYEQQVLTYGALNARSNQLAHYLRSVGVGPDVPVALCVERSPDMILGLLGILKAGGAYVPLDPALPTQRLALLITDSRAPVVVCQQHLVELFPDGLVKRVVLDDDARGLSEESLENCSSGVTPASLVYTLFTSGSTGTPKGVQIEHRQLLNYVHGVLERLQLPADASFATVSSYAADLGNTAIFPALLSGGCLHVVSQDRVMDPAAMAEYGARHGIDCLKIVPSHLAALLSTPSPERVLPRRCLVLGGEASTWDLVSQVEALSPDCQIMNHYGPTETTVGVLTYRHPRGRQRADQSDTLPLGRPLSHAQVYVLDSRTRPVPIGVSGELHIGGASLARGYVNRPDQTAASFVPNPCGPDPGARMYRTGDLARYLADGNVEFLGRADYQVKIRGFRVELGEIESILGQHESISAAVVLAREDVPGDKRLVGYAVRERDARVTAEGLRDYVAERLPDYMVPSAMVLLDQLPLNRNGKVDRGALLAIQPTTEPRKGSAVSPRTANEERLLEIFSGVLGNRDLGIHDDFFESGGHSLLAMQLIVRVREAFHVDLPLPALFDAPTVAGLAKSIESLIGAGGSDAASVMKPVSRGGRLPLSFAQQRLWFLDQLEPHSTAYNRTFAVRLTGPLNLESLQQSLREVIRRHEVLRTNYPSVDGEAQQIITAASGFTLRLFDLDGLPPHERGDMARRLVSADVHRPFDLASGSLVRACVIRVDDAQHVLVLSQHHINTDAWSNGVLAHEISTGYEAFSNGLPSPLSELSIQYADFAAWQRERLEGETLEKQLSFWKEELRGVPPSLELPTDRPRPAVQTFRGATRTFRLSKQLAESLKELSQKESATLFMTLLAAFQTLLHRYTGQPDILVGSPIAGRMRPEVQDLIGFFVNTLVLRADMRGTPRFCDLLRQVRSRSLAAYANQDLPFERLVDELELERDLSRTPLFQVMFVLQTDALESLRLPDIRVSQLETPIENAKFNLTLYMSETEQGLDGSLEYDTDLFDASTIDRMLGHFSTLLEGIVADPNLPVSDLPLLTEAEQRRLLVEWNDTHAQYPHGECLHDLIEAQVERSPDTVALVFEDQQLTYRELNRKANQLARYLRALGVGPEARVGLFLPRSVEMVVGVLGVLKAGGAYVPMDPVYPVERLAFMLRDSRATVVLTEERLAAALQAPSARLVCLDTEWPHVAAESAENLCASGSAQNLSHVIYTSGSTGQPKGVAIEQRSVVTLLHWSRAHYEAAELAGVLASTSICFDLSVWELLVPLSGGGTVILASTALELAALPAAHRVTLINTVPSAIGELLRMGGIPSSVRTVNLAGEPLTSTLSDALYALGTIEKVCDLYGPSEDTTYSTYARRAVGGRATIGRPLVNTRVYLGAPGSESVPIGVPGELHVAGAGLARGYLDRPDLTAERFLPDAFGDGLGERVYRTGDLARWHASGTLDFLGRLDHQVKIRGFRIELGEIEAVLRAHPGIRDAHVLAREDQPGAKRLVAYLTRTDEASPTVTELRDHLRDRLPAYMIPAAFLLLDSLPLLPNGKVDRRALPVPDQSRPELEEAFVPPRNPIEQRLAEIWCQVLGLERVGVRDNFFELGGDSILSIQIVSRANQAGLLLSARQLFEQQTIAELAAVVGASPAVHAVQGPVRGTAPLTAIQQWFFAQQFVDPHHFNQSVLLETREVLNGDWIQRAVESLLAHHDALRLHFVQDDGGWQQEDTAADSPTTFSRIDLSGRDPVDQRTELEAAAARVQASLDLDAGPQLRVVLFDLGQQGQRVLLVVHHLVVDGVSWRVLLEDLQTAYDQVSRGEAIQLPLKTTSYADWARRCREYAASAAVRNELPYWLAVAGTAVDRLPADDPHGANTVASVRSVTVALSKADTDALLRQVPDVYRTHINDVLLTAVAEAFAEWTGKRSLLIDLEGHGREELFAGVDISRTVGWFTTLFPVRLELSGGDDPSAALKSIKEQLRSVPNRGMGYGLLRYLSQSSEQIERLRSQPRAEVLFNYLGQVDRVLPEGSRFQWARESSGPTHSHRARRSYLMDLRGLISAGSLQVSFQYSENIFRHETIEQLARSFLAALRSLISHCQSPEAGGYTPSDFKLANLTQSEIDRHFGNDRTVEDVYALSPLQKGMLFHCLHAPDSGAYLTHLVLRLDGALDVQAFKRAWDRLIARHTVLRTGFIWDQVSEPVQVVRRTAGMVWSEEDWRGAADEEQLADLRTFLKQDRIRGFDLSNAPLIRLALIRIAEHAHYFVWTHHHLAIDGWSVPLVLQEVLELYKASLAGGDAALPPARPFRDYIAWLGQQDLVQAESYWRRTLAGLEAPTSLGMFSTDVGTSEVGNAEYQSRLSLASTRSLRAFAREHDLTVNTVVQGAWALLLGAYSGEEDVVYGAALSGRPPSLADVTRIPGMFINTLPIRVVIDADLPVRQWLGRLQQQQVEMREYEYSALTQVHGWSQVPRSVPLFDVIVAFQNFPVDKTLSAEAAKYGLGIELVLSQEQSTSPLTLFVYLEEELTVRLVYDRRKFNERTIAGMADRYLRILEGLMSNGEAPLMDLPIDADSSVPQLQEMAVRPPSAEELRLLGLDVDDTDKVTSERED